MFIRIEEYLKCSKCGSLSCENFSNQVEKGVRCLHCGHEKTESLYPKFSNEYVGWAHNKNIITKF
jgi:hypothetical protein